MTDPTIESLRQEQLRLRAQVDDLGRRINNLAQAHEGEPTPQAPAHPMPAPSLAPVPAAQLQVPAPASQPSSPPPLAAVVPARESFELHLGRVWLVRAGIGMLLTGLIFLASFTYQRVIEYITPFGRAAGLFTVSLALTGLGLWLEKSRETLRYYGRVLAAGGLAGGYYALYASHYVPALKWIDGGLASNLLLMAWAAVIIGVACWRRAETLGIVAIVLAYYTSLLGPDTAYTLVSNLILAAAAVFLTVRYGWRFLSYSALIGTYGTYAAFRLTHLWHGATPGDATLVAGYWAVFALAVLWPGVRSWRPGERVAMLTLNNVGYLTLGAFSLVGSFDHVFPDFAMTFGGVLIAAAFLSRRLQPGDTAQESAFFLQGVLVATLGWLSRWHGPSGALVLGVESALLLSASVWRYGTALRVLGGLAAGAAFLWASTGLSAGLDSDGWRGNGVPLLLAWLFAGESLFLNRARTRRGGEEWTAAYFGVLAALLYLGWTWERVPEAHRFWVLALSGAVAYAFQFVQPARFVNVIAGTFWALATVVFFLVYNGEERVYWANGLLLAGLFALERLAARRLPPALLPRPWQATWLSGVILSAWTFLGELVALREPDWSLTLVWAGIAGGLFALGLACRERVARWWGLGILAAALGRVVFVDVWQLGTLSRILTFLGLGTILLALGFVYNRWQDTIKRWL